MVLYLEQIFHTLQVQSSVAVGTPDYISPEILRVSSCFFLRKKSLKEKICSNLKMRVNQNLMTIAVILNYCFNFVFIEKRST